MMASAAPFEIRSGSGQWPAGSTGASVGRCAGRLPSPAKLGSELWVSARISGVFLGTRIATGTVLALSSPEGRSFERCRTRKHLTPVRRFGCA